MTIETQAVSMEPSQLAYHFAMAAGYELLGTEEAFALLMTDVDHRKYLAVFGNVKFAANVSFEQHAATDALEMARELDAVFTVVEGAVQCEVDGVLTAASTYVGAAIKAVVHRSLSKGRPRTRES